MTFTVCVCFKLCLLVEEYTILWEHRLSHSVHSGWRWSTSRVLSLVCTEQPQSVFLQPVHTMGFSSYFVHIVYEHANPCYPVHHLSQILGRTLIIIYVEGIMIFSISQQEGALQLVPHCISVFFLGYRMP